MPCSRKATLHTTLIPKSDIGVDKDGYELCSCQEAGVNKQHEAGGFKSTNEAK